MTLYPFSIGLSAGIALLATANEAPDLTNYGWLEMVARVGVAGLAMVCVLVLTTRTYPRRDKEKDESQTTNIKAILESAEKKMQMVVDGCTIANDKVCVHIEALRNELASGNQDQKRLLLAALTGQKLAASELVKTEDAKQGNTK